MFPHYKAIIIQREVGDYQLPMQCMGGSMKMIAIFGYLLLITLWITNKECWLQALVGILSDIQGKWCMCSVNSLVILNTQNLYLNNNEASILFTFCIDRPDTVYAEAVNLDTKIINSNVSIMIDDWQKVFQTLWSYENNRCANELHSIPRGYLGEFYIHSQ